MNNKKANGSKSKGKVFSIHVIKVYGGVEVWSHSFLSLTLIGDEWLAPSSSYFTSWKTDPNTDTIGRSGPKSWSAYFGEEKDDLLPLSGIEALLFSSLGIAYCFYGTK